MSRPNGFAVVVLACALHLAAAGTVPADTFDDSQVAHIDYPGWFIETPFLNLEEAFSESRQRGERGLMVLFTTEGCSYCDAFIRRSLGDPDIAGRLKRQFASVGLEIFDDAEMTAPNGDVMRVKAFAKQNGAAFSPTIVFFARSGEPVTRLVGYQSPERFRRVLDYVAEADYERLSLRDYLNQTLDETGNAALAGSELADDPLFSRPPYFLDRSRMTAEKPLLVIFERTACPDCATFHREVLADEAVRNTLRRFEVVRLDATAETPVVLPDGSRRSAADWFDQTELTRVPALMFFNEQGESILQTDALVLRQRMQNSLDYVLERAYEEGWTYQRFARQKGAERMRQTP